MDKKHRLIILKEFEKVSFQNKAKALLDRGYEMSGFNCCAFSQCTHYYAIFVKVSFEGFIDEALIKDALHEELLRELQIPIN